MLRLNRAAADAAKEIGPHAVTDVTGFGLLGHAHEMAHLSGVRFEIDYAALPWLPGARQYAAAWIFPGGSERNEAYFGRWVTYGRALADWEQRLLHDPQTSGGLLMAVAEEAVPLALDRLRAAGEAARMIGAAGAGHGEIFVRA
jgi:selenide,water dikinase